MTDETPITETKPKRDGMPKRGEEVKRVRVNMWLNQPTHRALKVWCTQRGVTMQSGLERMIEKAFVAKVATAPKESE